MELVALILTVCTMTQPESCEERQLTFLDQGTLMQCMAEAPPAIAQWSHEHPFRKVVKWRCGYPEREGSET